MAEDIVISLMNVTSEFVFYSIALDESTDVPNTTQLAIFIKGVSTNFKITQELFGLHLMKGMT